MVQYRWSHCSFPLSLGAHRALFVSSKTGVSGSPGLQKSCNQILLAFKVRFSGDSQSLCRILRLGSLTWDSEPSQQWENFFDIIFWVTHFSGMGFDFIMIVPLYCLSAAAALSLDVGCLFGRSQCRPVDGCSAASCDFGALAGGDEYTFFYTTILNWKSCLCFLIHCLGLS